MNKFSEFKDDDNDSVTSNNSIPFWGENPNILFSSLNEFFPLENMSYSQKLNAVSRAVILFAFLMFVFTQNIRIVVVSFLTLGGIWVLYNYRKKGKEGYKDKSPAETIMKGDIDSLHLFDEISSTNPLGNVLMTDYDMASDKKPAPPSYTSDSQANIMKQTKAMVDELHPEEPQISKKLYQSLDDNLTLEQSLRPFYSNPSTTIPNDQSSFADFCYGSMVSCKEGNAFACARNLVRHQL
jgi:hypothetical protein